MQEFARRSIAKDSAAAKRLSSLEEAIRQVQVGKPVILLDADHREGEGDFAIAAQFCTPEFSSRSVKNTQSPFSTSTRCSSVRSRR